MSKKLILSGVIIDAQNSEEKAIERLINEALMLARPNKPIRIKKGQINDDVLYGRYRLIAYHEVTGIEVDIPPFCPSQLNN